MVSKNQITDAPVGFDEFKEDPKWPRNFIGRNVKF